MKNCLSSGFGFIFHSPFMFAHSFMTRRKNNMFLHHICKTLSVAKRKAYVFEEMALFFFTFLFWFMYCCSNGKAEMTSHVL